MISFGGTHFHLSACLSACLSVYLSAGFLLLLVKRELCQPGRGRYPSAGIIRKCFAYFHALWLSEYLWLITGPWQSRIQLHSSDTATIVVPHSLIRALLMTCVCVCVCVCVCYDNQGTGFFFFFFGNGGRWRVGGITCWMHSTMACWVASGSFLMSSMTTCLLGPWTAQPRTRRRRSSMPARLDSASGSRPRVTGSGSRTRISCPSTSCVGSDSTILWDCSFQSLGQGSSWPEDGDSDQKKPITS